MDIKAAEDEDVDGQTKLTLPFSSETAFSELSTTETLHWFAESCKVAWKERYIISCLQRFAAAIVIQRWFLRTIIAHRFMKDNSKCVIHYDCYDGFTPPRISSFTLTSSSASEIDFTPETQVYSEPSKTTMLDFTKPTKEFMDDVLKSLDQVQFRIEPLTDVYVYRMQQLDSDPNVEEGEKQVTASDVSVSVESKSKSSIVDDVTEEGKEKESEEVKTEPLKCIRCGEFFGRTPSSEQKLGPGKENGVTLADVVLNYLKQNNLRPSCQQWFRSSSEDFYDPKGAQARKMQIGRRRGSIDDAISYYLDNQTISMALRNWCSIPRKKEIISRHLRNHIAAITIQRWYRRRRNKKRALDLRDPFLRFLIRNKSPELLLIWLEGSEQKRESIMEQLKNELGVKGIDKSEFEKKERTERGQENPSGDVEEECVSQDAIDVKETESSFKLFVSYPPEKEQESAPLELSRTFSKETEIDCVETQECQRPYKPENRLEKEVTFDLFVPPIKDVPVKAASQEENDEEEPQDSETVVDRKEEHLLVDKEDVTSEGIKELHEETKRESKAQKKCCNVQ